MQAASPFELKDRRLVVPARRGRGITWNTSELVKFAH